MMGHHPHDHHRPLSSPSSPPLGGPNCNSGRPNEVLGSNICQVDDKVAGATPPPAPEVSTSPVFDKTFQPFDLSTSTAIKSPAGGMAGDLGFPFTWAQWKELERQAMIYKYMTASLPVPPDLLLPIAQSLSPANPHYSLSHNGSVYSLKLGLSSSNKEAAEPLRCKRTDGKKWRCSRDVAPHQKYCERHLNRGRPRSRKPVEVLAQQLPFNNNGSINKKKTRFDSHNLPNPSPVLHSTVQANGIPLFLDRTDENVSDVSSYQELSRGFDWTRHELNLNPYTDFNTAEFRQDFSDEALNLTPYTDFPAPQMEIPRGFIDAWSSKSNDSNTNKKPNTSVSSHSQLWPSSLTLSMAMEAGNALDEEMGQIEEEANVSSWLSPQASAPGGPLAEMLRPNSSVAACSDSSPSEVLQRTLLSLSDSSGCSSPAVGAVPEMMPFQWLN